MFKFHAISKSNLYEFLKIFMKIFFFIFRGESALSPSSEVMSAISEDLEEALSSSPTIGKTESYA